MVSVILRLQHMDNKTKEVKATEGKGYLTIKSRRQPKAKKERLPIACNIFVN